MIYVAVAQCEKTSKTSVLFERFFLTEKVEKSPENPWKKSFERVDDFVYDLFFQFSPN